MIDLLIIGSGGAALSAALSATQNGKSVVVLSKTYPTASQTSQAQGGINGVIGSDDTVQNHISDTIRSAHGLGDQKSIEFMCKNGSDTIAWLDDMGVAFSRDQDNNIAQRKLGGATNARACYSSDYTGLKILHTLYDRALKENIEFLNEKIALNIIVEDETAVGLTYLDIKNSEVKTIKAKNIVIATGGYSGIYHNYTTNSTATTGDGVALALKAGCKLANMEYIQFHPTSIKGTGVLVSESARAEGGYLVTKNGDRFIDELKPRDEVARAIYQKIQDGQSVYLDLRHLGYEKIKEAMPQEYELVLQFASKYLDKDLIEIEPAAHYTMGGIKTDMAGQTNIKNLYAVGEVASNGVHGANRLGGNSLLEIITFGKYIGDIATYSTNNITNIDTLLEIAKIKEEENIKKLFHSSIKLDFYEKRDNLGETFFKNVGLFRDEKKLNIALKHIEQLQDDIQYMGVEDKSAIYNTNLKEFIEFKNMLEISKSIILSALYRKESRGAHYRVDFQDEKENYSFDTVSYKIDDDIKIENQN